RSKRAAFLRHLALTLKLPNVAVHRARFGDCASTIQSPEWISLQAVALGEDLIDSIRLIVRPTTTVVWITSSDRRCALDPFKTLSVPLTGTRVLLFRLDLS